MEDPGPGTPPLALRCTTMIVSAWFLLYGLACVGIALLGGWILVDSQGGDAGGPYAGVGRAIGMIAGGLLVGLGLLGIPHLPLAFLQFRTGRLEAGCRGLPTLQALLWVLLSKAVAEFPDDPRVTSIAVGVACIHGRRNMDRMNQKSISSVPI